MLRDGGETACHAQGDADVDWERKAGACAEEGASDGIEDCGVNEAFAGAEVVVRESEVALEGGLRQGANGKPAIGLSIECRQRKIRLGEAGGRDEIDVIEPNLRPRVAPGLPFRDAASS